METAGNQESKIKAAKRYSKLRALGFISQYGPQQGAIINYKLGLESNLDQTAAKQIACAIAAGTILNNSESAKKNLMTARDQFKEVAKASTYEIGKPMIDFAERIVEYCTDAIKRPALTRRDYLTLTGLALLSACKGKSPPAGPTPVPTPGSLSGSAMSLDGKMVNGTIDFLSSTNGPILASGQVNGAFNITFTDQSQISQIKRVRIRGDPSVCNTEINYSGNLTFKVLDRKLGIGDEYANMPGVSVENPSFYDSINRHAPVQAPAGLHKVMEDLTFYVDATNIGGGRQSPQERLEIIRTAIATIYPVCTGRTFNGIVNLTSNLPTPGNGNLVIKFDYNHGTPIFNGHRITGGDVGTGAFNLNGSGATDRAELAAALFYNGTNDLIEPSIANTSFKAITELQPVDYNLATAAMFETLGTKKARSFDGIWIESYEQPI